MSARSVIVVGAFLLEGRTLPGMADGGPVIANLSLSELDAAGVVVLDKGSGDGPLIGVLARRREIS